MCLPKFGWVFRGGETFPLLLSVPTICHYYCNILFIFLIALKVEWGHPHFRHITNQKCAILIHLQNQMRVKYIIFLVRMREWVFSASIQKVVNKNLTTNPKATNKEPTSNPKPTPNQGNPKSNPQTTSKQEATHKESRNNRIYVCIRIRFFQIRR